MWIVPSLYAAAALTFGVVLPRVESRMLPDLAVGMSVGAATAIYSSIASGMIALTGIVFSLVFVMVQFSATAYSPRLVVWVARSPLIAHALGVFTATFLYAIAALAWVDRHGSNTVPLISAATVVLLLIASVGLLILLIDRIALLSVNQMLTSTGDQARLVIDSTCPEPYAAASSEPARRPQRTALTQAVVYDGRPAVVQHVDAAALVDLATEADAVVEVVPAVGDTILGFTTLANVFGAHHPVDDAALERAITVGDEASLEHDPKLPFRLLADIAIRALSPAINDPTTAVEALDQIDDLLRRLGRRRLGHRSYSDPDGTVRVIVPFPSWDDFLRLALDEIVAYGAGSVQVMRRMKALLADLAAEAPDDRRAVLLSWNKRVERAIARTFSDPEDQRDASVADRQGLAGTRSRPAA